MTCCTQLAQALFGRRLDIGACCNANDDDARDRVVQRRSSLRRAALSEDKQAARRQDTGGAT